MFSGVVQSGTAEVELKKGQNIKLTLDDKYKDNCDENYLWVDYKNITKVLQVGNNVYIDDGLISLKVKEVGKHLFFKLSELFFKATCGCNPFILHVLRQRLPDVRD